MYVHVPLLCISVFLSIYSSLLPFPFTSSLPPSSLPLSLPPSSFPFSLPPSLPSSLSPPSLPPFLPPSLPPSFPPFLPPSLPLLTLASSILTGTTGVNMSSACLTMALASSAWAFSKLWNTWHRAEDIFKHTHYRVIQYGLNVPYSARFLTRIIFSFFANCIEPRKLSIAKF